MRVYVAVCLVTLLSFATAVRGQEIGLPDCSEADLTAAYELIPDYADLMDLATIHEATTDILLEYSDALFAWRDQLWDQVPLCTEAFDMALTMSRTANDFAALYAFEIAGVPPHISPHRELIPAAADTLVSLLERRADDRSSRNELPAEYSLPACSDAELDILRIVLSEFNALLELPPMMETVRGLANYSEAQTAWRETIWTRLPPCVSAFASGLLMSQISSDIALERALEIADLADLAAPISQQIGSDMEQLHELSKPFAAEESGLASSQSVESALPACTDKEGIRFVLTMTHPELLDEIGSASTHDGLLSAARRHLAWRMELDANLPTCAETLEIALLVYRATTFFTGHSLEISGFPLDKNAHFQFLTHLQERLREKTSAITGALADAIVESMDDKETKAAETTLPERNLPYCETKRLGLGFYNAFVEYTDVADRVSAVQNLGDVLAFFDAEITWTEQHFDSLPKCVEALEATLLMYRILADYSASFALLVAGAAFDDIPYVDAIASNEARLEDWMKNFLE